MTNENKTKPTDRDITDFIASLPENRQADTQTLIEIMQDISGEPPVLWGERIIGFGKVHYKYASGREGDWMRLGFAPNKANISLYITYDAAELSKELEAIGKYKIGKGCIYINKLADIDIEKLKTVTKKAYENGSMNL